MFVTHSTLRYPRSLHSLEQGLILLLIKILFRIYDAICSRQKRELSSRNVGDSAAESHAADADNEDDDAADDTAERKPIICTVWILNLSFFVSRF